MGKGRKFLDNRMTRIPLNTEEVPGQPIVEIAGDRRVLIECHRGVLAYSRERIQVGVCYGSLCVCGCGLEMVHMSREKLIIYGTIDSISLQRRRSV